MDKKRFLEKLKVITQDEINQIIKEKGKTPRKICPVYVYNQNE